MDLAAMSEPTMVTMTFTELLEIKRVAFEAGRSAAPSAGERVVALTFDEFSRVNRQRCESKDGFNHALESWSTSDWFLALLGELGEAANIAKKLNRVRDGIPGNKQTKEELQDKLRDELGDSFVYLDLLAQSLGISIGDAAVKVFNAKSEQLGCPIRMAVLAIPSAAPPSPWECICKGKLNRRWVADDHCPVHGDRITKSEGGKG